MSSSSHAHPADLSAMFTQGHGDWWTSPILWSHLVPHAVIALAFLSIPLLLHGLRARRGLYRPPALTIVAVFITACGVGHVIAILAAWHPVYWLQAGWNGLTALAAVMALGSLLAWLKNDGVLDAYLQRDAIARLEADMAARTDELLKQKALAERLIQHVPAGISYLDHNLVYRWVNPTQARMWNLPADQIIGRSVFEVFGPTTDAQIGPLLRGVLETNEPYHGTGFPFTFERDGQSHTSYWDFTYAPTFDAAGRTEGILVLAIEVSDRVHNEQLQAERLQRLQELDRYKDDLLSVISHELRTPLSAIMGYAGLLENGLAGPLAPGALRYVQRILHGAQRMQRLVNDLLDHAKISAGKLVLEPAETAWGPLVEETLVGLLPLAAERGVCLAHEVTVPMAVVCDGHRMGQVLGNLVTNAIKFTEAGRVHVRAYVEGDAVITEVLDTGVGIAADDLPRLFKPFGQLDMTASRRAGGAGLGLSISKALVTAQGGTIGVDSAPGVGSRFWFSLPLKGAAPAAPVGATPAQPPA